MSEMPAPGSISLMWRFRPGWPMGTRCCQRLSTEPSRRRTCSLPCTT